MVENSQYLELEHKPETVLRQFITRVWEHPLLTSDTRQHRHDASKAIELELRHYCQLWPDDYVAIPVGSVIWATNKDSDFDHVIIASTKRKQGYIESAEPYFVDCTNIGLIGLITQDDFENGCFFSHIKDKIDLLFVPDDYLTGSITMAAKLRLKIVEHFHNSNQGEKYWENTVRPFFNEYYRLWAIDKPRFTKPNGQKKNRQARIDKLIEKRKKQTRAPEQWENAFKKALANIQVPDIDTYYQGLVATNGHLTLLPRYRADGVDA